MRNASELVKNEDIRHAISCAVLDPRGFGKEIQMDPKGTMEKYNLYNEEYRTMLKLIDAYGSQLDFTLGKLQPAAL